MVHLPIDMKKVYSFRADSKMSTRTSFGVIKYKTQEIFIGRKLKVRRPSLVLPVVSLFPVIALKRC